MSKLGYLATGVALGVIGAVAFGYYLEQSESSGYTALEDKTEEAALQNEPEEAEDISTDENITVSPSEQPGDLPLDANDAIKIL